MQKTIINYTLINGLAENKIHHVAINEINDKYVIVSCDERGKILYYDDNKFKELMYYNQADTEAYSYYSQLNLVYIGQVANDNMDNFYLYVDINEDGRKRENNIAYYPQDIYLEYVSIKNIKTE